MERFANEVAYQAYKVGVADGVPEHVARRSHWIINLLLACVSLQDVRVIGPIIVWEKLPERNGLRTFEKWYVTFNWVAGAGAMEIRLERR